jgi:type I restriction enzyme S subunit
VNFIQTTYPLSYCISLYGGGTPSKDNPEYWNGDIPWASVKDLKTKSLKATQDSISALGLANSSSKIVKAGSIIIATRMAVGRVVISEIDAAINQDLKAVVCSDKVDVKYLFHFLFSQENNLNKVASGATVKGIKINHIMDMRIHLPPLAEQQKIASILDAADSLRQKDQQLIEKYTALSQSLFLEMFGDPKVNPNNWPLTALGKIIEEGPQNGLYKPSGDYGTGTPIIRIDSFHNSVVELSKLKRVRVSEGELSKFEIFEGDFVLNRVNSPSHLGKCGLVSKVKERMVFESNMMRIKFNKSMVNNTFMLSILSSKYLKHQILNSSKDAVNQSSINQKDVNSFEIPLPPIELQNQFAELIQAIEAQKKQAQASLEKSAALFNSLLQRAFKGELTT